MLSGTFPIANCKRTVVFLWRNQILVIISNYNPASLGSVKKRIFSKNSEIIWIIIPIGMNRKNHRTDPVFAGFLFKPIEMII